MKTAEYTITRHKNGYIEIRDCQNRLLQTADNYKEAEKDLKQLKNRDNFAELLVDEMAKIGC